MSTGMHPWTDPPTYACELCGCHFTSGGTRAHSVYGVCQPCRDESSRACRKAWADLQSRRHAAQALLATTPTAARPASDPAG